MRTRFVCADVPNKFVHIAARERGAAIISPKNFIYPSDFVGYMVLRKD